jgi:hypothetical protein
VKIAGFRVDALINDDPAAEPGGSGEAAL